MASRAVNSQQTFVAVPTMISVSMLRARKQRIEIGGALHKRAEAVFAHDRVARAEPQGQGKAHGQSRRA